MGRSKLMKRISRRRRRRRSEENNKNGMVASCIESLPSELVGEVCLRIATSSFSDFFNAKSSSNIFYEAADDKYILRQISLEKLPVVPWRATTEAATFLNKCKDSGNPEALYRQGVIDYFSLMRLESGLESLSKAASSGHSGAQYVLSIILLFSGDEEFKKQGIRLLSGIEKKPKATSGRLIRDCRENLRAIVRRIWVANPLVRKQRPICCAMRDDDRHETSGGAGWESDEDDVRCDCCRCDREVASVCNMFPRV